MQPTDQMSMAAVYSEQLSNNSGALYHRVTTYSVMKSVSDVVRASPKSQIFRSQFELRSRLLGFKSRCKTFAECMYFSPRSNWYMKYCEKQILWCEKTLTGSPMVKLMNTWFLLQIKIRLVIFWSNIELVLWLMKWLGVWSFLLIYKEINKKVYRMIETTKYDRKNIVEADR